MQKGFQGRHCDQRHLTVGHSTPVQEHRIHGLTNQTSTPQHSLVNCTITHFRFLDSYTCFIAGLKCVIYTIDSHQSTALHKLSYLLGFFSFQVFKFINYSRRSKLKVITAKSHTIDTLWSSSRYSLNCTACLEKRVRADLSISKRLYLICVSRPRRANLKMSKACVAPSMTQDNEDVSGMSHFQ